MFRTILPLASLVACCFSPSFVCGGSFHLGPGQSLQIDFAVSPQGQRPDTLFLMLGEVVVTDPLGDRIARLYFDGKLLGVDAEMTFGSQVGPFGLSPSNAWKTASSLFAPVWMSVPVVNLEEMYSNATTARINLGITAGGMTIDTDQIQVAHGISSHQYGWSTVEPGPTITSVTVVPEGSALTKQFFAIVAWACLRDSSRISNKRSFKHGRRYRRRALRRQ